MMTSIKNRYAIGIPLLLLVAAWVSIGMCTKSAEQNLRKQNPAERSRTRLNAARPNIILIMADDMGYSDLGCMGSEIKTPNLDKLARNGLLMPNFYNTGRCCPTRASLLTGLYAHQAGVGDMTQNRGRSAYQGYLNDQCVTLGEVLQQGGYTTAQIGKWHVGEDPAHWPQKRGFDYVYGIPQGGGMYFFPALIDRQVLENDHPATLDTTFYSTDAFNDAASRFVRRQTTSPKPFFLYLAHIAPHFPLQARPADISRYRGSYRAGFAAVRQARYRRQQQLGVLEPNTKRSPADPSVTAWESLTDAQRDTLDLKMAIYAAQIEVMDRGIGRLVQALDETKQLDNTLILFLSDNGGEATDAYPVKGATGPLGSAKSWASYGKGWANVCNTPYRRYKQQVHEGGIRTPLIVHWPKQVGRGQRSCQVGHVIDVMPTLLDLAGATYPATYNGKVILPMEGKSLVSYWKKPAQTASRTLFWEHEGNRAVRAGNWKLVSLYPANRWELYNLTNDPTELNDLAREQPDKVRELTKLYETWASRAGVAAWNDVLTQRRKK